MTSPYGPPVGGTPDRFKPARISTILGIAMLVGWVVPFIGIPLGSTGLVLGIIGRRSLRTDLARAGIFLNALGLLLTGLNFTVSFYFLVSGKINPLDIFNN